MIEDRIKRINIEKEMQDSYIDYSMSVIVSRALPDVRDGFKPVHRRVLFGMQRLGNTSNQPTKKSARIVGEVMGKYHPHGDSSIYNTMVRLAQWWSLRYPLVFGQGNFGSLDGDSPAAMRYTEARLAKMGEEMLSDIDEDTIDFVPNFDNSLKEPVVLPTRFPNLLVNGSSGIAVGMATNMPPHNLTEAINASIALLNDPEITIAGLMEHIKAPDFPTGGTIYGYSGVKEAYETGRGRIVVRAKAEIETEKEHEIIVISEIPYNVNKAELVKSIADLAIEKKVEGINDVKDLSSRKEIRVIVEVKKDANANVLLNKLYKLTPLQSSFSVNNVALVDGRPRLLNLKEILQAFLEHRHEVVIRRSKFLLKKAEARSHIVSGLIIACDNIDEVVRIIRASQTTEEAQQRLGERFNLDELQTKAIVDMPLRSLVNMNQEKLHLEYEDLQRQIEYLNTIINDPEVCRKVIEDELIETRDKYGDERRTDIVYSSEEFNAEDFYADDDVIITISHLGYIKRTPLSDFRAQNRGGVGAKGGATRDEDFIEYIYTATMHNYMLFFTQQGRCYWLKVYDIPEGAKTGKGRAIQNLLNIGSDDKVKAFINVKRLGDPDFVTSHYLMFCTKNGVIKKTCLEAYSRPRQNGVNAIVIREGDELLQVRMTKGNEEVLLANRNGRAIRFNEGTVREMGRMSAGVKGMTLDGGDDAVVGMITMPIGTEKTVMVVSEQGYGKRSVIDDYRITNRGGKGVKTINVTDKTGRLVDIKDVDDTKDLVIINKSGITIRLKVADVRVMGRATQGVRLINLEKRNDEIASVCVVDTYEEEETAENDELQNNEGPSDVLENNEQQ